VGCEQPNPERQRVSAIDEGFGGGFRRTPPFAP